MLHAASAGLLVPCALLRRRRYRAGSSRSPRRGLRKVSPGGRTCYFSWTQRAITRFNWILQFLRLARRPSSESLFSLNIKFRSESAKPSAESMRSTRICCSLTVGHFHRRSTGSVRTPGPARRRQLRVVRWLAWPGPAGRTEICEASHVQLVVIKSSKDS